MDKLKAQLKRSTFESKFNRVEEWLVGLWRFRELRKKPKWCCTFVFKGNYHDTYPKKSKEEALDAVYRNVMSLIKSASIGKGGGDG